MSKFEHEVRAAILARQQRSERAEEAARIVRENLRQERAEAHRQAIQRNALVRQQAQM